MNEEINYCWFKWKIEIIKADHDGYCTDCYNEEEIYYINKYYEYELTSDEYYTLIWLNNECPKIFDNKNFIESIKPKSIKKYIEHDGSNYCHCSIINSMHHEIQRTPIKILEFNIDNIKTKRKKYIANPSNLKQFLSIIIDKNETINKILEKILPMEIIDFILKIMWNEHF